MADIKFTTSKLGIGSPEQGEDWSAEYWRQLIVSDIQIANAAAGNYHNGFTLYSGNITTEIKVSGNRYVYIANADTQIIIPGNTIIYSGVDISDKNGFCYVDSAGNFQLDLVSDSELQSYTAPNFELENKAFLFHFYPSTTSKYKTLGPRYFIGIGGSAISAVIYGATSGYDPAATAIGFKYMYIASYRFEQFGTKYSTAVYVSNDGSAWNSLYLNTTSGGVRQFNNIQRSAITNGSSFLIPGAASGTLYKIEATGINDIYAGTRSIRSIATDGTVYVALGQTSPNSYSIISYNNGASWSETFIGAELYNYITHDGVYYIAFRESAGTCYYITSRDGISWSVEKTATGLTSIADIIVIAGTLYINPQYSSSVGGYYKGKLDSNLDLSFIHEDSSIVFASLSYSEETNLFFGSGTESGINVTAYKRLNDANWNILGLNLPDIYDSCISGEDILFGVGYTAGASQYVYIDRTPLINTILSNTGTITNNTDIYSDNDLPALELTSTPGTNSLEVYSSGTTKVAEVSDVGILKVDLLRPATGVDIKFSGDLLTDSIGSTTTKTTLTNPKLINPAVHSIKTSAPVGKIRMLDTLRIDNIQPKGSQISVQDGTNIIDVDVVKRNGIRYLNQSKRNKANGYIGLDSDGALERENIPNGYIEKSMEILGLAVAATGMSTTGSDNVTAFSKSVNILEKEISSGGYEVVKTSCPTDRNGWAGAAATNGYFYVTGVFITPSTYGSNTDIYNDVLDSWLSLISIPESIGFNSVIGNSSYLYSVVGKDSIPKNSVYIFDSDIATWSSVAVYPLTTGQPVLSFIGDVLFSTGGANTFTNLVYSYNQELNSWSAETTLSLTTYHYGSAVSTISNQMILGGGITATGPVLATNNFIYNPITRNWSTGAALLETISGATYADSNSALYTFGGSTFPGPVYHNKVFKYVDDLSLWKQQSDITGTSTSYYNGGADNHNGNLRLLNSSDETNITYIPGVKYDFGTLGFIKENIKKLNISVSYDKELLNVPIEFSSDGQNWHYGESGKEDSIFHSYYDSTTSQLYETILYPDTTSGLYDINVVAWIPEDKIDVGGAAWAVESIMADHGTTDRRYLSVDTVDGYIHMTGGSGADFTTKHEKFNDIMRTWINESTSPATYQQGHGVSDSLWILFTGSITKTPNKYNTISKSWSTGTNSLSSSDPQNPHVYTPSVVSIIGGSDTPANVYHAAYSVSEDSWTTRVGSAGFAYAVGVEYIGEDYKLIGGSSGTSGASSWVASHRNYSYILDTFTSSDVYPHDIGETHGSFVNGNAYVFSGRGYANTPLYTYHTECYKHLDIQSVWVATTPVGTSRYSHNGSILNNAPHILGGLDSSAVGIFDHEKLISTSLKKQKQLKLLALIGKDYE